MEYLLRTLCTLALQTALSKTSYWDRIGLVLRFGPWGIPVGIFVPQLDDRIPNSLYPDIYDTYYGMTN